MWQKRKRWTNESYIRFFFHFPWGHWETILPVASLRSPRDFPSVCSFRRSRERRQMAKSRGNSCEQPREKLARNPPGYAVYPAANLLNHQIHLLLTINWKKENQNFRFCFCFLVFVFVPYRALFCTVMAFLMLMFGIEGIKTSFCYQWEINLTRSCITEFHEERLKNLL